MANRREHVVVGAVAGLAWAGFWVQQRDGADEVGKYTELLGGTVGGYIGGLLPDYLEPATSRYHRQLMHSVATLVGVAFTSLVAARAHCRAQANAYLAQRLSRTATGAVLNEELVGEAAWSFVAGFLSGMQAGYVSHLLLDARTPMRLPLLGLRP